MMLNTVYGLSQGKIGTVAKCLIVLGLVAACGAGDGGFINAGS